MSGVAGKRVVLGVTGSIAAFKAAQLCSTLVQAGAEVDVILTAAAQQFLTPLTFQSLTRRPAYVDLYAFTPDLSSAHVTLGAEADVLVVCPASATTLARLARGSAEDMLSCTALASTAPLVIAPAMNVNMWQPPGHPGERGHPGSAGGHPGGPGGGPPGGGDQRHGAPGPPGGRPRRDAAGPGAAGPWIGRRVVVTAGGTQERSTRCATSATTQAARWATPSPRRRATAGRGDPGQRSHGPPRSLGGGGAPGHQRAGDARRPCSPPATEPTP